MQKLERSRKFNKIVRLCGWYIISKIIFEKYQAKKNQNLYTALIDREEIYDWVKWKGLLEVMKVYGVVNDWLNEVKFYSCATAGYKSAGYKVEEGMRKVCAMLPMLFNIYMDGSIK